MNLMSKSIQVGTRKINANVTKSMVDDLTPKTYYEYKFENESEKLLIEKHFKIDHLKEDNIYYYIDNQILRKIKLLVLNNDDSGRIIQEIMKKSKKIQIGFGIDMVQAMEKTLVDELTKSIDKDIIRKIMKMNFKP
jgi:hypothetical protein